MTLIEPTVERERGRHEPPYWPVWSGTFEAAHVVAFGTHWRATDYVRELEARLSAGEILPFSSDGQYYNDLIKRLLDEDQIEEAVGHYVSSRNLWIPLQQAAMLLSEAARRGQIITRAAQPGEPEVKQLPSHEWANRERFRLTRDRLFKRGEATLETIEWNRLEFWTADAERLHVEGLAPAPRPEPISAEVVLIRPKATEKLPPLNQFQSSPATLKAAVQRMEKPNYSRPDLAGAVCDLYREAGGNQRAGDPVASVVKTWKQQSLTLADLIALAGD